MHPRFAASALALILLAPSALAQDSGQAPPPPGGGANPYARLLLQPDLSAIATFNAAWNDYDVEAASPRTGPFGPADKLSFHFQELELGLQSVIDPYAKASIFIAFSPEEIAVEEAYLTTLALPAGLQLKAGRFFSSFGRINGQHPHTWDFVDGPLAHGRVLADEVLAGPGVDLAWLAPVPWFAELHLALQDVAPGEGDAERLLGLARLAQFFSLSDELTLGVGLSAARRDEGPGQFRDLAGGDLYLRWRALGSRHAVTLQAEGFARRYRNTPDPADPAVLLGTDRGGYVQATWRGEHWGLGARYDQAPAAGDAAPGTERRLSGLAAWYLTEFQRLRLQVSHDERPGGQSGWEALLHLEFGIGAHGAHPF